MELRGAGWQQGRAQLAVQLAVLVPQGPLLVGTGDSTHPAPPPASRFLGHSWAGAAHGVLARAGAGRGLGTGGPFVLLPSELAPVPSLLATREPEAAEWRHAPSWAEAPGAGELSRCPPPPSQHTTPGSHHTRGGEEEEEGPRGAAASLPRCPTALPPEAQLSRGPAAPLPCPPLLRPGRQEEGASLPCPNALPHSWGAGGRSLPCPAHPSIQAGGEGRGRAFHLR